MNELAEEQSTTYRDTKAIKKSIQKGRLPISGFLDRLSGFVGIICCLAILGMVLMISYEVIARYFFNEPTSWVTEYSLYIFVGTSFLAAAYAHVNDAHIRVEIVLNSLSNDKKQLLWQVSAWLGFFFVLLATWQMTLFVISEYIGGARAWGLMATPLWIPEAAVAVGLGFFALALLSEILKLSTNHSRRREFFGLALLVMLVVVWVFLGSKPLRIANMPLDWGTLALFSVLFMLSWLWSGGKIALASLKR